MSKKCARDYPMIGSTGEPTGYWLIMDVTIPGKPCIAGKFMERTDAKEELENMLCRLGAQSAGSKYELVAEVAPIKDNVLYGYGSVQMTFPTRPFGIAMHKFYN